MNKPNTGSEENILCFVNDMDGDILIPTYLWLLHLLLLYLVCSERSSGNHCIAAAYTLLFWKQCTFKCLTVMLRGSKQLKSLLAPFAYENSFGVDVLPEKRTEELKSQVGLNHTVCHMTVSNLCLVAEEHQLHWVRSNASVDDHYCTDSGSNQHKMTALVSDTLA